MINRTHEKMLVSLIIQKMQIKTTMGVLLHSCQVAIIKKTTNNSVGKDVEKGEHLCIVDGNAKWNMIPWENSMEFPQQFFLLELPYDPGLPR